MKVSEARQELERKSGITDFDLFHMFNMELAGDIDPRTKNRERKADVERYGDCLDMVKLPLWKFHEKRSKRVKPHQEDKIRPGITNQPPGKDRVADLIRFYAQSEGESPFNA
jgi:hypothetical protein